MLKKLMQSVTYKYFFVMINPDPVKLFVCSTSPNTHLEPRIHSRLGLILIVCGVLSVTSILRIGGKMKRTEKMVL